MIDRPAAALGNITDSEEVEAQVFDIVRTFAPGHDLGRVEATFALLRRAFAGDLPGYGKLQTLYHNTMHTNEVVLCSARMLHGLHLAGKGLNGEYIDAALIGALLHDSGYLMRDGENAGTGAQFTAEHVNRGVDFARQHLNYLPESLLATSVKVIQMTDHHKDPDRVKFDNPQQQLAAHAAATADLVAQMANREYLERLLLLYFEFQEAKLGVIGDVHDLLENTAGFYHMTRARLDNALNGLAVHLKRHFAAQCGEERNFYYESIDRNLAYLERLVKEERARRLDMLRRGGIVERVRSIGRI